MNCRDVGQGVELEDLLIPSAEVEERSLTWLRRAIGSPGTKGILEIPETYFDPAGSLTLSLGDERREIPVCQVAGLLDD